MGGRADWGASVGSVDPSQLTSRSRGTKRAVLRSANASRGFFSSRPCVGRVRTHRHCNPRQDKAAAEEEEEAAEEAPSLCITSRPRASG